MGKARFAILCFLVPILSIVFADTMSPVTNIADEGLLILDWHLVGGLPCEGEFGAGRIRVKTEVSYFLGNEDAADKSIVIEVREQHGTHLNTIHLDMQEIERTSAAIGRILGLLEEWANIDREDTKVTFIAKEDLQIGFDQKGSKQTIFVFSGIPLVYELNTKSLKSIKSMIDEGFSFLLLQ